MAVITKLDKTEMRQDFFRSGNGREFFKGTNPTMNGPQLLAVLQAIEDDWEIRKVARKAKIDVAAGTSLTDDQAKVLGRAWLSFKAKRGG